MGDKGATGQPMGARPFAPPKRKRLSRACNWCRNQKVRCDESLPSCNNCRLRNLHCLTTEPKTGKALSSADRKHSAKHAKNNPPCRSDLDSPSSSTTASSATSLLALPTPISEPFRPPSTTLASASNAPLPVTWTNSATPGTTFATPQASSHGGLLQSPPKPPIRPAAAGDQIQRGPAHLTPQSSDYALNYGDEPVRRKFLGASSSQVLVQWLDLSFSRRGPWPNISRFFRYGISTAEEFSPTLWISPKPLPRHSECATYLSVYKLRIHPLFPVLDLSDFASTFTRLSGKDARSVSALDLPSLACCQAVTSIGMDAISGKPSETATEYLSGAYSMYAHIVAMPYQRSIQALLLLALALRTRHKEGVAWHVIGHAIRMAQSLGLHRHQGSQEDTIPDMGFDRNIWWSLFCLEKMMALQTGRPSAIHDEDCDQTTPPTADTCSFLHHLVGLAQVQSAIAQSMTTQSGRQRGMHEFLHDTVQLDHQLVEWEQKLPNNLRPGSALYCTPEDQPFASFFSVSYHEA
ncbi:putative transcriptional regulatory protein [Diplodia seriata]|uniref:Putative transcriptional regulatory protein n=1 Tax=Diplodia seriata TaxID=420778 RepID=A0A1S8BJR1_9PEZI|nr:putative transcriptional regulatory protein [Diplodia seriata]